MLCIDGGCGHPASTNHTGPFFRIRLGPCTSQSLAPRESVTVPHCSSLVFYLAGLRYSLMGPQATHPQLTSEADRQLLVKVMACILHVDGQIKHICCAVSLQILACSFRLVFFAFSLSLRPAFCAWELACVALHMLQ